MREVMPPEATGEHLDHQPHGCCEPRLRIRPHGGTLGHESGRGGRFEAAPQLVLGGTLLQRDAGLAQGT